MRYICLVYLDEVKMVTLAKDPAAIGAFEKEIVAYDQKLNEKGVLVMASPLKRVREAVNDPSSQRAYVSHGWPTCRDEGTTRWLHVDQRARPQRGDRSRRTFAIGKDRIYRSASGGHPGWPQSTA
jgi:hypothetical protein